MVNSKNRDYGCGLFIISLKNARIFGASFIELRPIEESNFMIEERHEINLRKQSFEISKAFFGGSNLHELLVNFYQFNPEGLISSTRDSCALVELYNYREF